MKTWWNSILLIVSGAVVCYLLVVGAYCLGSGYVDRSTSGISLGTTRADVRKALGAFRETKVTPDDIPDDHGYMRTAARRPGVSVYRYSFLCRPLSVHILYDRTGRVRAVVPSYE